MEKIVNTEYYRIYLSRLYRPKLGVEYGTEDICRDIEDYQKEIKKASTERDFEEYRAKHCPSLPSRQKCYYICKKDAVEIWLKKLGARSGLDYKVFKLLLTGGVFWANYSYFDADISSEKYWKGSNGDHDTEVEGLFLGKFTAIEDCTLQFRPPM